MSTERKSFFRAAAIMAVFICLSIWGTLTYVSHEKVLYWSDYWQHFHAWQTSVQMFHASPPAWLAWLVTADAESSPYYTIFNLPAGLLFGTSRITFELSVLLCYAWPFLLLSSLLLSRLFKESNEKVFWAAFSVLALNPLFWAIPLRGYPDYAAECVLMLAWLLYLEAADLPRSSDIPKLGFLLGFAPLLRRHFAYPVLCQFVSMFAFTVWKRKDRDWREYVRSAQFRQTLLAFVIIGVYAAATEAVLAMNFFNDLIHFDYGQVFLAFHMSPGFLAQFYCLSYGIGLLGLATLGWLVALKQGLLKNGYASLFLGYGLLLAFIWFADVQMVGPHYTAHFTWLLSIGGTALVLQLIDLAQTSDTKAADRDGSSANINVAKRLVPSIALASIYGFLAINLAYGLGVRMPMMPSPTVWQMYALGRIGDPLSCIFSAANPPVVRRDLPEIARLCRSLVSTLGPRARLSIASSSPTFNDELLFNGFMTLLTPQEQKDMPQLIKLPQINYRDDSPIHNLAQCDCIVVAQPFQYHLTADRQTLLAYTVDSFTKHLGLANGFEPSPERYYLQNDVELTVYNRVGAPTLQQVFQSVQAFLPYERRPHKMLNPWLVWHGLQDVQQAFRARARQHVPVFTFSPGAQGRQVTLIYLGLLDKPTSMSVELNSEQRDAQGVANIYALDVADSKRTDVGKLELDQAHRQARLDIPARSNALLAIDLKIGPTTAPVSVELPELKPSM